MSTTTPTLTTFTYEGQDVRSWLDEEGTPWFVLADLCRVLDLRNSRDVAARLDEDTKGVGQTDTLGGPQQVTIVSEAGMYEVVLRSDKPEARTFRRWITHDVLPALRRTGTYTTPTTTTTAAPQTRAAVTATVTRRDAGMRVENDWGDLVPRVEPCRPVERMPMTYGLIIATGTTSTGTHVIDELMSPDPEHGRWVSLRLRAGRPAHTITRERDVERYWLASAVRLRHVDAAAQVLASADPVVRARGAGVILTEMVATAVTA